jgi:hypothetical protein
LIVKTHVDGTTVATFDFCPTIQFRPSGATAPMIMDQIVEQYQQVSVARQRALNKLSDGLRSGSAGFSS